MSERYCVSCEEGNHHRCRDEWCGCCGGGSSIRENNARTKYAPEPDPAAYLVYHSPEGYHVMSPTGNEQWFKTPELRDNYLLWHAQLAGIDDPEVREIDPNVQEALNRPVGSSPFQDWAKLGQVGSQLRQQADAMKGSVYQTQGGDLMFYKNQMEVGEQPMIADVTKGIWTQQPQQGSNIGNTQMQNVFSPKTPTR